jgi:hypothetical protein
VGNEKSFSQGAPSLRGNFGTCFGDQCEREPSKGPQLMGDMLAKSHDTERAEGKGKGEEREEGN